MREGSVLNVATVPAEPGSRIEFSDVLLLSDGDRITIGSPTVPDATVVAEVLEHGKGKKVISFKYKAKVRYRRKRGHRQDYTRIAVRQISTDGAGEKAQTAPRRRSRATTVETKEPPEMDAEAQAPAEEKAPAGRKAPARSRRKGQTASETEE